MRQVKGRLTESRGGDVKVVVVFCDTWDSASFQEEHREELGAHARNGVRFLFMLVGVPDRVLVPVPVEFDQGQGWWVDRSSRVEYVTVSPTNKARRKAGI